MTAVSPVLRCGESCNRGAGLFGQASESDMNDFPPHQNPSFGKAKLGELFGVDLRSLALFRILIALILLCDLVRRAADLSSMYVDGGIMPIDEVRTYLQGGWRWSLHWLDGSLEFQTTLFVISGLLALTLLLGYRTRLATIGCWIMLASLHTRAPLIINNGDLLLRLLLFWSIFLPLGTVWSVDARRYQRTPSTRPVVSIATFSVLIQVCLVYWFSALFKFSENWSTGEALHQVLSWGVLNRPLADWLRGCPMLVSLLTVSTVWLELLGPLLLFIPWRTPFFRLLAVATFISFHLAIEMLLHVGIFSWVSITAWMLFLPGSFWSSRFCRQVLDRLAGGRLMWVEKKTLVTDVSAFLGQHHWKQGLSLAMGALCLASLALVFFYNVFGYLDRYSIRKIPAPIKRVGELTMLAQRWTMFCKPPVITRWYVAKARLKNGREVDLIRGASVNLKRPFSIARLYSNQLWRKFCDQVSERRWRKKVFRQTLANYLFHTWNSQHFFQDQIAVLDLLCIFQDSIPGSESNGFRRMVHARVEASDVPLKEKFVFDTPW